MHLSGRVRHPVSSKFSIHQNTNRVSTFKHIDPLLFSDWQFGEKYCTISNFIAAVTVCASVLTLTGISCDRYLAIVHPLHPRISRRAALSAVALIWAVSSLLGVPCLLYSRTITYTFRERIRTSCILVWPDGMPTTSEYDYM